MNIILRELKANWRALAVWAVCLLFMIAGGMTKFSSAAASGQSMNEMLGQLPRSLKTLLGLSGYDLTSVKGYYGMLFTYLQIMAGIYAAMLGADIIAKEQKDKTAEFLFTKPLSRLKIIALKLGTAALLVFIFCTVSCLLSLASLAKFKGGADLFGDIFALHAGLFAFGIVFMLLGAFCGAVTGKAKSAGAVPSAVLIAAYFAARFSEFSGSLDFLKYLTPFKYFDAISIYGGFSPVYAILTAVLAISLTIAALKCYDRRNLGA